MRFQVAHSGPDRAPFWYPASHSTAVIDGEKYISTLFISEARRLPTAWHMAIKHLAWAKDLPPIYRRYLYERPMPSPDDFDRLRKHGTPLEYNGHQIGNGGFERGGIHERYQTLVGDAQARGRSSSS